MPRTFAVSGILLCVVLLLLVVFMPLQAAAPNLTVALAVDAPQPAAGQRVYYTLNVSNPGVTTTFTATLHVPLLC